MVAVLNPNLVLIGYMGTGKTTVGRQCARALGFRFVDTDKTVERRAGRSISQVFAEDGEPMFRQMEKEAIREAALRVHVVIATGGGAVLDADNVRALRSSGVVVWLCVGAEEIARRCRGRTTRPLLADAPDLLERVRVMLAEREPYYRAAADAVVETTGLPCAEAARLVLSAYKGLASAWTGARHEAQ